MENEEKILPRLDPELIPAWARERFVDATANLIRKMLRDPEMLAQI